MDLLRKTTAYVLLPQLYWVWRSKALHNVDFVFYMQSATHWKFSAASAKICGRKNNT